MDYLVRQFHYSSVFIFVLDIQNDKHPLGNCLQLKEDEMLQKFSDNFETEKLCGKVRSCHGGSQQYEKVSLYFNYAIKLFILRHFVSYVVGQRPAAGWRLFLAPVPASSYSLSA